MSERLRILVVDSDVVDRLAIRRAVEQSGLPADLDEASDATPARADCIVVGGDESAIEIAGKLRSADPHVPILLVVSHHDEALLEQAVDAGVTDFIVKTDLSPRRLALRIQFAVRVGHAEAKSNRAALAKDEILAVVSHDLRSPLHAISLASEALADELGVGTSRPGSEGPTRYLGAIERATMRAERLISDLLEASAIENGALVITPSVIDAAALVRQAVADHELIAKESGAHIEARLPAEPVAIRADRERILQVLNNLIGNSLKHAKGSPIEVTVEPGERLVTFSVRDHGPGIPPAARPHIFDRYWRGRARKGGAGLGLAIAQGIVAAHGGDIGVDSTLGEGARFYFTLPRAT